MTDDNCDNLAMSIAKDRRYLNEMIPNGLQAIPIMESQHDSNISTSSSNTIYDISTNSEYQTDIPFPRPQLSIADNLNQLGYGNEGLGEVRMFSCYVRIAIFIILNKITLHHINRYISISKSLLVQFEHRNYP